MKQEALQLFSGFFEENGCRIDVDEHYRDRYGIDFSISHVDGVHSAFNLGIHLSFEPDCHKTQDLFLEATKRGVVSKGLYIEICANEIDTGVIPVTFFSSLSFLFNRRFSETQNWGLKVFQNHTFHFFDLEDNVRHLRITERESVFSKDEELKGKVVAYFKSKGYGFIISSGSGKESKFFFHIANVKNNTLRDQLEAYTEGSAIPVCFTYGGSNGQKYPKALNVQPNEVE